MDLLAAFCRQRKDWIMPKTHENTHTHSINDALRDHATAVIKTSKVTKTLKKELRN